jgi:hypothetical protein
MRNGHTQKASAKTVGVSTKRLRAFLRDHKLARQNGGKWIFTDRRVREVPIISTNGESLVRVRGFSASSLIMQHRFAVQTFLETNDVTLLTPFSGISVKATDKITHFLETRPNVLYRLANAGSDADMKIYRLIS